MYLVATLYNNKETMYIRTLADIMAQFQMGKQRLVNCQLSRARGMGGGLNHLTPLSEFMNNRNTPSLALRVWTTDVKSTISKIIGKSLLFSGLCYFRLFPILQGGFLSLQYITILHLVHLLFIPFLQPCRTSCSKVSPCVLCHVMMGAENCPQ